MLYCPVGVFINYHIYDTNYSQAMNQYLDYKYPSDIECNAI